MGLPIFSSAAPKYPVGERCAQALDSVGDTGLAALLKKIFASSPVTTQRNLLARLGRSVQETPLLWKRMPGPFLRVIFPVTGGEIEEGTVAAVVVLHDLAGDRTLYAHPMHAGPGVNPLLANLDGPMAHPKAQPGKDGDRATRRMIEHKRSLWARFRQDRETLGSAEAGRRWRTGYFWALRRLYFCSRCPDCKWGTPCFEGLTPGEAPLREMEPLAVRQAPTLCERDADRVAKARESDPWKVEVAYAARGRFQAMETPYLIQPLEHDFIQMVFPTRIDSIQGGTLVALAAIYHDPRGTVTHAHCLSAGPDPEILFLRGDTALGLPTPRGAAQSPEARAAYADWRHDAWTRFWLNELEEGVRAASQRWLQEFWLALEDLFGGNRLADAGNAPAPFQTPA